MFALFLLLCVSLPSRSHRRVPQASWTSEEQSLKKFSPTPTPPPSSPPGVQQVHMGWGQASDWHLVSANRKRSWSQSGAPSVSFQQQKRWASTKSICCAPNFSHLVRAGSWRLEGGGWRLDSVCRLHPQGLFYIYEPQQHIVNIKTLIFALHVVLLTWVADVCRFLCEHKEQMSASFRQLPGTFSLQTAAYSQCLSLGRTDRSSLPPHSRWSAR